MNIDWIIKSFTELTTGELYKILQLRNEVFVVEQHCIFQDADNKDQHAHHLMGMLHNELVAYTRLLQKEIAYPQYASIGRVVTAQSVRRKGAGKILMQQSINSLNNIYGVQPIKIGAQLYLKKFYESLGFLQTSDVYDEDGIDHIEMILLPQ
jgi:ElaA protein